MSLNSFVTKSGGEMGRAQVLQAQACRMEPDVRMNPVLLKPNSETGSQVIVLGKPVGNMSVGQYIRFKPQIFETITRAYDELSASAQVMVLEGAGSPAEVNLRPRDIANMGFARAAGVPVVLAGDIDRGGVIAQIVGTQAVIDAGDAAMIRGFLVNKFRGDPRLFDDGYRMIEARTGWRGFGVVPWFADAHRLPAEDAVDLRASGGAGLHVVCLTLSRIANFDDLDPLAAEPGLRLTMLAPGQAIPGDAGLVIVPGTKSTLGDLAFLRAQGWDIDLAAHHRRGGHVLGICGGYQMLGRMIDDPSGADGVAGQVAGLGLLDVTTVMAPDKRLTRVTGTALGQPVSGYEIHMGRTDGPDCARPFAHVPDPDGAISADGRVTGSYLHGLFSDDAFRAAFLARLCAASRPGFEAGVDAALDDLADHLEAHLDVGALLAVAR